MIRVQFNRLAKFWMALTATLLLMGTADQSFGQVTNANVYAPASYTNFQPPAKGGSYTDAVFGTAVKRLSDSMKMTRADMGSGTVATVGPEYSTMTPFNMDNSRLILQHFSYFGLYDGAGNYLKDLPFEVNSSSEPRWSVKDPNILYYVRGNQLKQVNVGSNAITLLHTFSEYSAITGAGESDISADGNHFVFVGNGRYVFVYDIAAGTKGNVFDTAGNGFDSLYISARNNVTITWNAAGTGRYRGIEVFDSNMTFQRQLTRAGGHMDIGIDVNGDDIILWANSADPAPIANCNNGIVKVRLADARQTCLVQLDWNLAVHVSAPDNNGWVLVETYVPSDIIPPTSAWKTYTDEFLQVKLDGTEVRRIAHHRSRPLNSYTYMPKISTSRDGSKMVFGSNFGLQAQIGNPTEYSDAYMIDLGPAVVVAPPSTTTPAAPISPAPPAPNSPSVVTRVQQDANGIAYAGAWMNNSNGVHSGGSAKLSMETGARAMFSFNGTGANWIGYSDEWSGIAKVYIDGILKTTVNTYKAPGKAQSVQYSVTGLAAGSHTLTIEVTGTRATGSAGSWIWIDAFEAIAGGTITATPLPTAPAAPAVPPTGALYHVEETAAAVKLAGSWMANTNAVQSGGSAKLSMEAGAKVSFTFTGNAITWIAYRDMWSGIARVSIDGVVKGDIDTYAASDSARARLYSVSGLAWGSHTITIEVLGRHGMSSQGSWVWVDAFDYNGLALQ